MACAAYGCSNRSINRIPGLTFHRFPKNEQKRKAWIIAVRRKDWQPSHYSVLCSEHFENGDFYSLASGRRLIKENVVPTVFKAFPSYLKNKNKKSAITFVSSNQEEIEEASSIFEESNLKENETTSITFVNNNEEKIDEASSILKESNLKKNETTTITFVSSNQGKIDEASSILKESNLKIKYEKVDLPELQGDLNFICAGKCKAAAGVVQGPVIVEDTSLSFQALHSLPGPYIKWFYEKLGSDGLYKLLAGFEDKSASAICVLGFTEGPGEDVILCHGETKGTIVEPRGKDGFGWDSCFLPEGMEKTYAEMTFEEKNQISHRRKALNKLKMHFEMRKNKYSAYCY